MMITTQQIIFLISLISPLIHFSQAYNFLCTPSSCGDVLHIKYPFRLKGDPWHCGSPELELVCENNGTSIYLNSHQYYVKAIHYPTSIYSSRSTIRLVDASLNNQDNCSFPTSSAYHYNFTHHGPYLFRSKKTSSYPVHFLSCPNPLKDTSLFTDVTTHCASNSSMYAYIKVGQMRASELPHLCTLDLIVMTSWPQFKEFSNVSLSEIHQSLLYGFELYIAPNWETPLWWVVVLTLVAVVGLSCAAAWLFPLLFVFIFVSLFLYQDPFQETKFVAYTAYINFASAVEPLVTGYFCTTKFLSFPLVIGYLIYKFRRRHLSIYEAIECFLQSTNELAPIRYSYSDIKKMTRGFREKLGEGGYGHVYKGKLRSGNDVAIKMLKKTGGNGQDFMNEIATIGRIHHINVVKLVGYCAHGSKRALMFDFMSNGSLDKYLFNQEKMDSLDWERKFDIAVGVARGIEYLHRGCDIQILHFDIKPHNVLLDDNFIPKVSDFGLAKYFSKEKNSVTLTAARGTIGYVAPELINRGIGTISYKADVYSFGMMLMDIVGLKRDLVGNNDSSSKYFPYWIYDHINQGKDYTEIGCVDENDGAREVGRKMAIVALWCIQMNPGDRPSMNEVLKMLEGDVERLLIPKFPSQSTHIVGNVDQTGTTCSSDYVSFPRHDDSFLSEITVQE